MDGATGAGEKVEDGEHLAGDQPGVGFVSGRRSGTTDLREYSCASQETIIVCGSGRCSPGTGAGPRRRGGRQRPKRSPGSSSSTAASPAATATARTTKSACSSPPAASPVTTTGCLKSPKCPLRVSLRVGQFSIQRR